MISVVIATHDSEMTLVRTLAALVPGALAGIVREVIVADAGSRDQTATVADIAGCRFVLTDAPLGARLTAAAASARAQWLLFLRPGLVLHGAWLDETARFVQEAEFGADAGARAAVFRMTGATGRRHPALAEALALVAATLGAPPRPDQGLLIGKALYEALGGHRGDSADPERGLLRRLGRRRIVTLSGGAAIAKP
ncbi:MAG: hypothetical protein QOI12_324 [Alphaproteobacteria bacterium]|jgi:glycosyltransferase involved in cell wall biosynthesis|nr:hypothetical protein [Alphaproteobacteria bacterium]